MLQDKSTDLTWLWSALAGGAVTWLLGRVTGDHVRTTLQSTVEREKEKTAKVEADVREAQERVNQLLRENASLQNAHRTLERAKEALARSSIVRYFHQPVVLLGPRGVGKSSLLRSWGYPWDRTQLAPTPELVQRLVPVYDDDNGKKTEPHFAIPEVSVPTSRHFYLSVHDFPGELSYQMKASEVLRRETDRMRKETGLDVGVVLVCMFDAIELLNGPSPDLTKYYNGDLFSVLTGLIADRRVSISKIVFVINKYDILCDARKKMKLAPELTPQSLRQGVDRLTDTFKYLKGACNPEKYCEVLTTLRVSEADPLTVNADIVRGEVARPLIVSIVGSDPFASLGRGSDAFAVRLGATNQ